MGDGKLGASAPEGERDVASAQGLGRRDALKVIAGAGGLLAAHALLPRSWTSPLVVMSRLPAHAATSFHCKDDNQANGTSVNLTAERNADGSVVLRWDGKPEGGTVWRRRLPDRKVVQLAIVDPNVSTYTDFTAQMSETYEYWVDDGYNCFLLVTVERGN